MDSAPKDGTWFLAFYPREHPSCYQDQWKVAKWVGMDSYGDWIGFIDAADSGDFEQPIRWMPLPPPPSEQEG
jgi:hypothetical protein